MNETVVMYLKHWHAEHVLAFADDVTRYLASVGGTATKTQLRRRFPNRRSVPLRAILAALLAARRVTVGHVPTDKPRGRLATAYTLSRLSLP